MEPKIFLQKTIGLGSDLTFHFNKVYFLISDLESKEAEMLYSDVVERKCNYSGLECQLFKINSKNDFKNTINFITNECKNAEKLPYMHIECHGGEDGIKLKSKAKYSWEELGNLLAKINLACKNNLFVSLASCYGGYLSLSTMKNIMGGKNQRAPVCGFLGPREKIEYGKLESGFNQYFSELLVSFNFNRAIELMNKYALYKPGYTINTCQYLFRIFIDEFIKGSLSDRFKNNVRFNTNLYRIMDMRFKIDGIMPTESDYKRLANCLKDKEFYISIFNEIANNYFMIGLYPENKSRFGTLKDIDNWNELVKSVQ